MGKYKVYHGRCLLILVTSYKRFSGCSLHTVTGETAPITASCELTFLFGTQRFVQVAFVAVIFEECILGLDFLQANGCSLDLKSHTLDVSDEHVILYSQRAILENGGGFLLCSKSTLISPQSENVIWVTDSNNCSDGIVVAEGDATSDTVPGIIIARTLIDFGNEKVPIRIANLTDKPIHLKKGCRIAKWSRAVSFTPPRKLLSI